jgi:hypothetical protein
LDLQLLVPITTKVVSLNHVHGVVYWIKHYVIKFCQWFATGWWFSPGTLVSSTNKTDTTRYTWNIIETGSKHCNPNPLKTILCSRRARQYVVLLNSDCKIILWNLSCPFPLLYDIFSISILNAGFINKHSLPK